MPPDGVFPVVGILILFHYQFFVYINTQSKGDMFVTVNIAVPKRLTNKQKDLLKAFGDELNGIAPEEKEKKKKNRNS